MRVCILCHAAVLAAGAAAAPLSLYVATSGRDTWTGHLPEPNAAHTDGPFATLQRAREEIRRLKSPGQLREGVTVFVRGGTHYLADTLELGPQDSGTAEHPIRYTRFGNERVVLKGSCPVAGWRVWRDGTWRAELAGSELASLRFSRLFYDGVRQPLARFPNADPKHPRSGGCLYVDGVVEDGSKRLLRYNPACLDPTRWQHPEQVRVTIWPWLNWNLNTVPIKRLDAASHVIELASDASYKLIRGNRFFVDNALEELDAAGEWFLDREAKVLYFRPPDGQDPNGRVTVDRLSKLIRFTNGGTSGAFTEHVHLHGLRLVESGSTLLDLRAAAHCQVTACTLTQAGGHGLTLSAPSHHNRVAGCDISRVGGMGILLNGGRDWQHRLERGLAYNQVTNNHVHHVGESGNAWAAIMLGPGCGGNVSHDNVISHNLVHDTPRQGIAFNGFRNTVEYNHVHHTNQEQSDTGAIGMGSRDICERGSVVRFNYVHDTGGYCMLRPGVWEYPHYCWGIYLDDYTSGVHVYGNICVRTYLGGVMVHGGQDNVIENNIIVDGLRNQLQLSPIDSITSGRTPGHPDKSMWLMTGTRIVRNIICYDATTALYINGRKWEQALAECDRNLIRPRDGVIASALKGVGRADAWTAWRKLGYDANSVVSDPLFVDPANDDYRLQEDSPAHALGFQPIPVDRIGLLASDERASWPVPDDCWREEYLTQPGGLSVAPPPGDHVRNRTALPRFPVTRVNHVPVIDGRIGQDEWPGAAVDVSALSMDTGKGRQPSSVRVAVDGEALYVALENRVSDAGTLLPTGGTWGQTDGAEVCIQAMSPQLGPVFVIQGYPSGKWESVTNAGTSAADAARVGEATRYAASIGNDNWIGEWRIPLAALGINPKAPGLIRFNIGVLKGAERQWIAWVSAGGAPWHMERAGQLEFQ